MRSFAAAFDGTPALISPDHAPLAQTYWTRAELVVMPLTALAGDLEGDDWGGEDDDYAAFRPYSVSGGILTIPVKGVLTSDLPWAIGTWVTGYEYIEAAFARGMIDPDVDLVVFDIDSPGGEAAGNFELVEALDSYRTKPVHAVVGSMAYSAAYNIAAQADRITLGRTSGVGSIGVVMMHMNVGGAMEKSGVEISFIYAGEHKVDGNPYQALSDDARARMQSRVDSLYTIFVEQVALGRGLSTEAVRGTQALTYHGEEAVDEGLADEVSSRRKTMAALAASTNRTGDDTVPELTQQFDLTAARTEGATAERARIATILASDAAKARPKAALSTALRTNMTADDAVAFLADLPAEAVAPAPAPATAGAPKGMFDAAMRDGNPNVGAAIDEAAAEMSAADRIFASAGRSARR